MSTMAFHSWVTFPWGFYVAFWVALAVATLLCFILVLIKTTAYCLLLLFLREYWVYHNNYHFPWEHFSLHSFFKSLPWLDTSTIYGCQVVCECYHYWNKEFEVPHSSRLSPIWQPSFWDQTFWYLHCHTLQQHYAPPCYKHHLGIKKSSK